MKFYCEQNEFSEAVSTVQRAVSAKATLPALEGILIRTRKTGIELIGYDLELGIIKNIPADVEEPGAVVLNAKLFSQIIKKMPAGKIEVTADERLFTTISSEKTEFTLIGISEKEFPKIPEITECENFSVPQNILAGMLRQTNFCISTDDTKPVHTGSLFELSDGYIRIVSVDGFRLAVRTEQTNNSLQKKFVVPGKTLNEVLKMLSADSDAPVEISIGKKHVLFKINGYTVVSRLLDGEFLNYRSIIDCSECKTKVTVDVKYFKECVERSALIVQDKLKSPVICDFDVDCVTIHCKTAVGKSHDKFPVNLTGEPCKIGFNSTYLLDALHSLECDKIKILLNGPLSPMEILPTEDGDIDRFIFIVLPVRLKNN